MSGLFHSRPIGSDSLEFDRRSRPTELAADELWQPGNERGNKNIKWIVREFSLQEGRERANSTLGWKTTPTCLPEGQLIPQLHTPAIEFIKWFFYEAISFWLKVCLRWHRRCQTKQFFSVPTTAEQISSSSWILMWLWNVIKPRKLQTTDVPSKRQTNRKRNQIQEVENTPGWWEEWTG